MRTITITGPSSGMKTFIGLPLKPANRKLPTLSDGKPRYVTPAQYASLVDRAKKAGKPLKQWLELGGHLEKKK